MFVQYLNNYQYTYNYLHVSGSQNHATAPTHHVLRDHRWQLIRTGLARRWCAQHLDLRQGLLAPQPQPQSQLTRDLLSRQGTHPTSKLICYIHVI